MKKASSIKNNLKAKGWSYRKAAKRLGITYQYLCDTANGKHKSKRLEKRVEQLEHAQTGQILELVK